MHCARRTIWRGGVDDRHRCLWRGIAREQWTGLPCGGLKRAAGLLNGSQGRRMGQIEPDGIGPCGLEQVGAFGQFQHALAQLIKRVRCHHFWGHILINDLVHKA